MEIKGYASTPNLDLYRHVVMPSSFDASIVEKGLNGPTGIRLLYQHDRGKVIGSITKLETRATGLWMEANISEEISYGRDVAAMIRATDGLSFSVGFFLLDAQIREDAFGDEYLYITRGELEEVSVVPFPGQPKAQILEWSDDA